MDSWSFELPTAQVLSGQVRWCAGQPAIDDRITKRLFCHRFQLDQDGCEAVEVGMVKTALPALANTASFSPRSATRTATIGPAGGADSPKRLRSALLKGRSQAKALPPTNQVRLPWRSASVTSGSSAAIRATSSMLAMFGP